MKRIIEKLIYALAFLLPLQTRWIIKAGEINGGYSEYGTMSLYSVDILLMITIGAFAFFSYQKIKGQKKPLLKNALLSLVGALEFIIFMSIFSAFDNHLALFLYGRFLLGIGLFFVLVNFEISRFGVILFFALGVFVQALLGIWQFVSQSSFANKWLGLAWHDPVEAGVSVVEVFGNNGQWERWLRAYGGQDHPNILGGLLVLGILFLIFSYIKTLSKDVRLPDKMFFLFSFLFLVLETALFFTFSRTAWIGLSVGVVVMLGVAILKKNLLIHLQLLKIILLSAVMFGFLYSQYGALVDNRVIGKTRLENISQTERSSLISTSVEIIKSKWFFGTGLGNYVFAEKERTPKEASWFYQPVHNAFLLIWAEIGFIGFFLFISLLQFVFGKILERAKENKDELYQTGIFLSIIFMMMLDHWWWSLHMGVILFWFVLGLLCKNDEMPVRPV